MFASLNITQSNTRLRLKVRAACYPLALASHRLRGLTVSQCNHARAATPLGQTTGELWLIRVGPTLRSAYGTRHSHGTARGMMEQ